MAECETQPMNYKNDAFEKLEMPNTWGDLSVGPASKIPNLIHYRMVLFHTLNSGLIDLLTLYLKFSFPLFPSDDGSGPPPSPSPPPPRFTRVPCPLHFARFLSIFIFPFASSPSVSVSRPPPPAASDHLMY